jgi:hypothetical protein
MQAERQAQIKHPFHADAQKGGSQNARGQRSEGGYDAFSYCSEYIWLGDG